MPKSSFMPKGDDAKLDLLQNVAAKIATYATALDISTAEVTSIQNDALAFEYALNVQNQMIAYSRQWTAYKNLLRDGGSASATMPAAPTLPTPAPPAVAPGIFVRLGAMVARGKKHKNYSKPMGEDLMWEGAEQIIVSGAMKPLLRITMQAAHPIVVWQKGHADALEIWVDRGDGKGFAFLAIDTEPDYPDTAALPAGGASAVWKYKAIYRMHDEQVGQWSDVSSATVVG